MNINDAVDLLNKCKRVELRDHYFSDREIAWYDDDKEIAYGYFGGSSRTVTVIVPGSSDSASQGSGGTLFKDEEADRLALCGKTTNIFRNDQGDEDQTYGGP